MVDLSAGIEAQDLARQLLEDAQENCVSAFDGFGREAVASWALRQSLDSPKRLSFQNLEVAAGRLAKQYAVDFRATVEDTVWASARTGFLKRHLIAHRAGVVDQQYLDESCDSEAILGRRLGVEPEGVVDLTRSVAALAHGLISALESKNAEQTG